MEWILHRNIMAGMVILCIVTARKIFIYRIPGRIWLLLWKILMVQLLCPFTIALRLQNADVSRKVAGLLRFQEKIKLSGNEMPPLFAGRIMKIIWLLGVIVIAGIFISSHLTKRIVYCTAIPVKENYFEEWRKSHALKRTVEIKESDRIAVPLTYGVIRPVILLPAHADIRERNLAFVLEHEFIHIRCLDVLLKWILAIICSIYWYNPLIWVMYNLVNRDMELSCDEVLLKNHTPEYRKEYLQVLIDLEEKRVQRDLLCSSFCKYPMEERIRVMVMTERYRFANVLLSLSIVCLITILSIGITARVQRTDLQDESATVVISCGEEAGEVPYIIGYDEKKAGEILGEQGFALTISQAIIKRACISCWKVV